MDKSGIHEKLSRVSTRVSRNLEKEQWIEPRASSKEGTYAHGLPMLKKTKTKQKQKQK